MGAIRRVAVIGAGPAGAITIDALAQEQAFDIIRVFERREEAGGCWIGDREPPSPITDVDILSTRTGADPAIRVPPALPAQTKASATAQPRFTESSMYPYLETNIDFLPMSFSQEPTPQEVTEWSRGQYGPKTPFRPWASIRQYIQGLIKRRGYEDFVSYNTTVELAQKIGKEWKLTLRKQGRATDYWWVELFDAIVVASGHYFVPYIPYITGLAELNDRFPGLVLHSKQFRGRESYKNKRVLVVGASVSAADIAFDLVRVASRVDAVVIGRNFNGYFGGEAFNHPRITKRPSINSVDGATRTVHFEDGTSLADIDNIIFGTGYSWTLPFLPTVEVRNNRVPKLYQHVVYQDDPTLLFVGAVQAGLTFKIYEWQAVFAARLLAGRSKPLPPVEEQQKWEADRIKVRGDGAKFPLVFPDFEQYFTTLRDLAGPGAPGKGRQLPPFDKIWLQRFLSGHKLRKAMWRKVNAEAHISQLTARL